MQFRDLRKQYLRLKAEIDAGIAEVIDSSQFISGPKVKELEGQLAAYTRRRYCVSCANGTDALEIVLRAWGIGPGDAVFVPSFTFMSTAEVVCMVGAHPFFVDIDLDTFNISVEALEKTVAAVATEGSYIPKVVIPVDLFGLPANFAGIMAVAEKFGLKVIEDGAQGFGGAIDNKRACSFGDVSTTSFFPAKPLGCYGDGGAIFTDHMEQAELLTSLCVHGKGKEKYENIRIGCNSRLDSIQAAILLPKLKLFIEYEIDAVNRVATNYSRLLGEIVQTPVVPKGWLSSWAQYTVLCRNREERDRLQARLKAKGVPSMVYYPCGLHRQKAFSGYGYQEGSLPNTEDACRRVLSLPIHPYLEEIEIKFIADIIKAEI